MKKKINNTEKKKKKKKGKELKPLKFERNMRALRRSLRGVRKD